MVLVKSRSDLVTDLSVCRWRSEALSSPRKRTPELVFCWQLASDSRPRPVQARRCSWRRCRRSVQKPASKTESWVEKTDPFVCKPNYHKSFENTDTDSGLHRDAIAASWYNSFAFAGKYSLRDVFQQCLDVKRMETDQDAWCILVILGVSALFGQYFILRVARESLNCRSSSRIHFWEL